MFSVMGLGMQTEQSCCGAFTVAVGIIGLMTAKEGQTDVSNMEGYGMIAELTDFMLGFALMEVRDELRRVTQNEMLCDWSTVWQK